jgi:uncharacterized membrane protein YozB (DUF420 family)/cytochrome oxidase Cu insertion factor (SCO1/SenC/PrrC family)
MRKRTLFVPLFLILFLASSCQRNDSPVLDEGSSLAVAANSSESFGTVADFSFTERRGKIVRTEDLLGEPYLAGFIFTRCSTICPALTQELSRVQQALQGLDARVVAITVDPQHDTPEVLSEYASHFEGGDSEEWLFLRGEQEATFDLIRTSFKLGIERQDDQEPGLAVSHSSLLVAVDAKGAIRGFYSGVEDGATNKAIRRMRFLVGAPVVDSVLPTVNACFNFLSAVLLILGFISIRAGNKEIHARYMRSAFLASSIFLAGYLYYHFMVIPAQGGPVTFGGEGAAKSAYLVLLFTHVLGAIINLPMVLRTFWLAHRQDWETHKKWARWTFPLWMYVSVTGVMVYFALYVL